MADRTYRSIVADPPWPIRDARAVGKAWANSGGTRSRPTPFPYQVQSLEWIESLPVARVAERDAHLFLWVPASLNREGIGVRVARAWGFDPLNEIVWAKTNFGLGRFPRPQHEILLVCRRGNLPFNLNNIGSVQTWSQPNAKGRGGKIHSAKPDASYDLIQQASPGPYIELFSRVARLGWETWGDEALHGTEAMPA